MIYKLFSIKMGENSPLTRLIGMSKIIDTQTGKEFSVLNLPDIWGLTIQQNWLVEDLIPTESVIMLTGESGCGKSTLTLALADAISKGEPFLDRQTKQSHVLVVDKENGLPIYHERLQRFGIEKSEFLHFWGHWCEPEPHGPDCENIINFAREYKPLIIFDSFIAFHNGNEQDATETRDYMDAYRKLAGVGATVVIIHHIGKGENTKEYRGSSDIKASIDVGYTLTAKKKFLELLILKPFKSREGVLEPVYIKIEGEKFVVAEDKDLTPVMEAIKANPGANQSQLISLLPDVPTYAIRRILDQGTRHGTIIMTKGEKNASQYSLSGGKDAQ